MAKTNPVVDYKEIRCPGCHEVIGWHHILRGRIRLRCGNCDRIMVMVFRRPRMSERVDTTESKS